MVKSIIMYSDGTLDSFDADGCKVPHYCGNWSNVIHTIAEALHICTYGKPSTMDSDRMVINPTILFKISNGESSVQLTPAHFMKISKQIKDEITFE